MNNFCSKYNLPIETAKKLLKDGHISCSWPNWEEIYDYYKKQYSICGNKGTAVQITSVDKVVSEKTIYQIIHRIED